MKSLLDCRLYAFVDTAYLHGREPATLAKELCDGGADLIQLRAKHSTKDEVRRMAEAILPILRQSRVGLVINDHWDVAVEIGADFCHLGQEDFFDSGFAHASQLAPNIQHSTFNSQPSTFNPQPRIGLSTHRPDQAVRALQAQPAYIAIGPVYATGTKPTAQPVTLDYVRWAARHVEIPWFAIGGITLANTDEVLAAGARRICVVSAILNAPDISAACRAFKNLLLR